MWCSSKLEGAYEAYIGKEAFAFPISWFIILPASLADELRKTTKNLNLGLPVAKTDMQTSVFLVTIQPHNSTASPGDGTGRYVAWLIYRV